VVELKAPPEIKRSEGLTGALAMILPMFGSMGMMVVMAMSGQRSPRMILMSGLFVVAMLSVAFLNIYRNRTQHRDAVTGYRREYLSYLSKTRKNARSAESMQRESSQWHMPHPSDLPVLLDEGTHVGDREPSDNEFLLIRVGTADQPFTLTIVPAETSELGESDPVAESAAAQFHSMYTDVKDLPLGVDLATVSRIQIAGRGDMARALARAMIVQTATFTDPEDYRGINAAMHTVEALLVTADVTGEGKWLERAIQITDFAVNRQARNHGWRLPEHYDTDWRPRLDYNEDQPAHPFRPYGVTPGHGLEWSRLTVQAHAALKDRSLPAPDWMLQAAERLFAQARADGWERDGAPGFVYTTDFEGTPIVHERMHWVVCEGISAAAAVHRALLDAGRSRDDVQSYEDLYRSWLDYAEQYVIETPGVWTHELDASNAPSTRTWAGHPDVYHALQATLMSRLPVGPSMCKALAEGLLDS